MPIKAKRLGGVVAELAPPTAEDESRAAAQARLEREVAGHYQLEQLRQEHLEAMDRFAKGWQKYREAGWEWVDPDWEDDPETWPPLAKLIWLWDRAFNASQQANWLRHFTSRPGWCEECHEGESRPDGWQRVTCLDHLPRAGVATIARDWGVRKGVQDEH